MVRVRIGDSFSIGPFYARLSDGTVLDLSSALIESACKLSTGGAEVYRQENAAAGGSAEEIEVTDLTTGEFYVHVTATESASLVAENTYRQDARVKISAKVYTVGEVTFRAVAAVTPTPA